MGGGATFKPSVRAEGNSSMRPTISIVPPGLVRWASASRHSAAPASPAGGLRAGLMSIAPPALGIAATFAKGAKMGRPEVQRPTLHEREFYAVAEWVDAFGAHVDLVAQAECQLCGASRGGPSRAAIGLGDDYVVALAKLAAHAG